MRRIDSNPCARFALACHDACRRQFSKGTVHRRSGALEFFGQFGLIGNDLAGLPSALIDPPKHFFFDLGPTGTLFYLFAQNSCLSRLIT